MQNGAPGIYLQRDTDAAPAGRFLDCRDAAGGAVLASIGVDGGAFVRGLQIAPGFPLRLGTLVIAGSPVANGYVTVLDEAGAPIKLMTAA